MFKPLYIFLLATSLLCTSYSVLAKSEIVIIANKSSVLNKLNRQQAKKLWLGKIHKLPGTGKIKVIDQPNNSTIKEEFYQKLANMNLDRLKVYWAKIIFSGKDLPPKTLRNDQKIIEFIKKNIKYIGYIHSDSLNSDVKVLMRIR